MSSTAFRRLTLGSCIAALLALHLLKGGEPPQTGPVTEKRFPPLKVPPGFKATLFACDPLIEYPSVISIGPQPGAIFVAIDYMTGLVRDGKVKSEIRLIEDTDNDGYADQATVIAKGFNSIQGLAYHDGAFYVMHAPFLSVLRPKAQGQPSLGFQERIDLLTGLGLKPEDNRSRLHCANGVVVGHDGWLYLAMGDNGVNVRRPEGDRLIHHGGAILRCRPDGRDLHVFSTGLRNIYDIALDAELNVFTRDNENDGGTYMIRVCHSFFGADHGYPYDYEERPDYALKPIGDFGLGSSAGGVCYLESQFPPTYRGNLFFCEWGKSLVRYELKRAGSGFAPVKEIEFAFGDPKDTYPFKPTDVVVQRDGTMMVADYADGQEPKRGRGRIYHIKYVGPDADPVKKKAKTAIEMLNSESYFKRCEGQAAFERKGIAGKKELGDAARNNMIGPQGYAHVMWAVARTHGDEALIDLMANAKLGGVTSLRVQAIRAIADLTDPILVKHKLDAGRGDATIAKFLADLPDRQDPRILLEIVIAMGRLRWNGAPDWLDKNLDKPDAVLAHAAMQTLRRADNWPAVMKLLDDDTRPIRAIALRALSDRYETEVVDGLISKLVVDKNAERRREYAEALTRVYKKPAPWKYWGYRPGPRPANSQGWERSDAIEKSLDRLLADPDRSVRLVVLKRMQREKVRVRLASLGDWLKDEHQPDRAAVIVASLADQPVAETATYLKAVVLDKQHSSANRLQALAFFPKESDMTGLAGKLEDGPVLSAVLRRLDTASTDLLVSKIRSSDAETRATAIERLGKLGIKEGRAAIVPLLQDKDVRVRRAAAGAAGDLKVKEAAEPLLKLMADADVGVRLASLDSLRRLREPTAVHLAVASLSERMLQLSALEYLSEFGGPEQADAVAESAKNNPTAEVPAAAVRALTAWQKRKHLTGKQRADLDRLITKVHGDSGILVRWESGDADDKKAADAIIEIFTTSNDTPIWTTRFAVGTEGRLILADKADTDKSVSFAFTDVTVAEATPVEFLASSRGSFEVWLNGKSIHRRPLSGSYKTDSDRFNGQLIKGRNRILVQAGASNGPVEFHLRFRRKSAKAQHEKLTQAALNRTGNAERGRKIFFDKDKSQCIKCHQIGNQGERIGPELTGVGARFSRIYLVESILEPSRTIAPSFGTIAVTLKNGKTLNGIKIAETDTMLTLADNQGLKHVLAKADIDEQNPTAVSTMPEGLEIRLTEDEFVDLIAFLANQKAK